MKITPKNLEKTTISLKSIIENAHEYFRPDELFTKEEKVIAKEASYFSPSALVKPAIEDFKPEITYYEF